MATPSQAHMGACGESEGLRRGDPEVPRCQPEEARAPSVVSDRRIGIGHELEVRKQRTRVFCLLFDCSCGQLQFKRGGTVTARTVGGETSLLSATTTPPMYLVSPDRVFSLFPLFSPFLLSRNIKFSTPVRNGIVTEYFAFTTSPS